MGFSKLQTIALIFLMTILTNRLMSNQNQNSIKETIVANSPTPVIETEISPTPIITFQNEILLKEIQSLRKEVMASIKDLNDKTNTKEPVLTVGSSLIGGMVQINSSQWQNIDVYEKSLNSSKIIGSIKYGTIYFYHQKTNDWYEVYLDDSKTGWVRSIFLEEIP